MVLPESSGDEEENKQHKFYKEFAKVTKCDRDEDASDEDLEIMDSQTEVCTTCPITRSEMKDPLRSTKCGHSYHHYDPRHFTEDTEPERQSLCHLCLHVCPAPRPVLCASDGTPDPH